MRPSLLRFAVVLVACACDGSVGDRTDGGPGESDAGKPDAGPPDAGPPEPDAGVDAGTPSCPAPAAGSVETSLAWGDVDQLRLAPGLIASYPVIPPQSGAASIVFTQGQQPSTPADVVTEFTVSRCRGVIDASAGQCYYRNVFVNYNALTLYERPTMGWVDQATLGANGCWAPETEGPWYVNVRWTYATCPFFSCGFSMQWSAGPW